MSEKLKNSATRSRTAKNSGSRSTAAGTSSRSSGAGKGGGQTKNDNQTKRSSPAKRRRGKKSRGFFVPLAIAFLAGSLMALLCFVGVDAIRSKPDAPSASTASARATEKTGTGPSQKQNSPLPKIGSQQRGEGGLQSEKAIDHIQQALLELQQPEYTDQINVFAEKNRQVEFAIMQASSQKNIPSGGIVFGPQEERGINRGAGREGAGGTYFFQPVSVVAGPDFFDTLETCLESWNTGAFLRRLSAGKASISLGGVVTHEVQLFPDKASLLSGSSGTPSRRQMPTRHKLGSEPVMVIVIDDLGESQTALRRLLSLDFPVTCAFFPYGSHTPSGAETAHRAGREIIVHQPMEPLGYPSVRPGKDALLVTMGKDTITRMVRTGLDRVPHAVGLNNHMGSRFTQDRERVGAVLRVVEERGLFVLDSLTHAKSVFYDEAERYDLKRLQRSVFLDVQAEHRAVLAALQKTERLARLSGQAIAIGHPLPATLSALEEWQHTRDKKIRLVRLSDL